MHPLAPLIGRPWAVPCDPPHTFDCWALVCHVRRLHGLTTPEHGDPTKRTTADRERIKAPPSGWRNLTDPHPYCVVKIGETHVGVYLGRGQVIHSAEGHGVRIDRAVVLARCDRLTFWEWLHG